MKRKDSLTGHERELYLMAEDYEQRRAGGQKPYLDAVEAAELSEYYSRRHRIGQAFEVVDYALELHPDDVSLLVQKAYLLLDKGLFDEAKALSQSIPSIDNEVALLRAYLHLYEGDIDHADAIFEEMTDSHHSTADIIDMAYAYADNGWPDKAIELLATVSDQTKAEEIWKSTYADCLSDAGRYDEAASLYNELIDINPYSAPYWYALARCQFEQQDYQKAIEACDFALVNDDEMGDAYFEKGHCYLALGNNELALPCYEKAVKYGAAPAYYIDSFKGLTALDSGQWLKAEKHLTRAISRIDKRESDTLSAHLYSLAFSLFQLDQHEKALTEAEKAITVAPRNTYVLIGAARLYSCMHRYTRAEELWREAISIDNSVNVLDEIGRTCLDMARVDKALIYYSQIAASHPGNPVLKASFAALASQIIDKETCRAYFEKAFPSLDEARFEQIYSLVEQIKEEGDLTDHTEIEQRIIHLLS